MAFASSTLKTRRPEKAVAVACLQAQHVAGLPAAAEGRHVLLHLVQQHQEQVETTPEEAAAAARCTGGVAAFHDQVILLHCAPAHGVAPVVDVVVTVSPRSDHHDSRTTATVGVPNDHHRQRVAAPSTAATVRVDLAEQLCRPSPRVLSFVLGGGATAGAVLSLALHHRLISRPNCRRSCCLPLPPALPLPDLRLNCIRMRTPPDLATAPPRANKEDDDGDHGSSSSSGFITIEKGTISRRRPPSDNLLTTDDDEGDKPGEPPTTVTTTALAEQQELDVDSSKVVAEFLAMLEEADRRCCYEGGDLDLATLVEDAEAELAAVDSRS